MLAPEPLDARAAQVAPCRVALEHELARIVFEVPAQPFRDGHAEAHLRAIEDVVREVFLQRLLEDALARGAGELELRRNSGRVLHEDVIEKRAAHLERDGHGGAVHLGENVLAEIGLDVQVLDPR